MVFLAVKRSNGIFLAIECDKLSRMRPIFSDPLFNTCPCMGTNVGIVIGRTCCHCTRYFVIELIWYGEEDVLSICMNIAPEKPWNK